MRRVRIIKRDTRHFAKRQLTWFRREPDVIWINKQEFGYSDEKILTYILRRWQEILREEEEHEEAELSNMYETLGISREVWEFGEAIAPGAGPPGLKASEKQRNTTS